MLAQCSAPLSTEPDPAADLAVDLAGGTRIGRYVVLQKLGTGGSGAVYSAFDPELDRKIAVKVLFRLPSSADGQGSGGQAWLVRESQALARLAHPNVVAIHDVGTFEGRVFIAMELVAGGTLGAWLGASRRRPEEVLARFLQAGHGLAAAHAKGLVHRDFKPENVLVGLDGRARVTDFGLARSAAAREAALTHAASSRETANAAQPEPPPPANLLQTTLTQAGVAVGTPAYMAPEQFAGGHADPRSDQFSFCVALYRALWGRHPFLPEHVPPSAATYAQALARGPARSPPRAAIATSLSGVLSGRRRRAILKGLSLEAAARHPSMDALLGELSHRSPLTPARALVLGGALLLAAVPAAQWVRFEHAQRQPCTASGEHLLGVWDATVRARVESAFARTQRPYAGAVFETVSRLLDEFRDAWTHAHEENCRATQLRHEQPARDMDLRNSCLERHLEEARAATRLLAQADVQVVEKAVTLAEQLKRLGDCDDVAALARGEAQPAEPEARQRIDAQRRALAEAQALERAGKFDASLRLVEPVRIEAARIPFFTLRAEADLQLGLLYSALARPAEAESALRLALGAAERGRQDRLRARVLTQLVHVTGFAQRHHDEADAWDAAAMAAVAGSADQRLRATLLAHEGAVLGSKGKEAGAALAHRTAIDVLERLGDRETPQLADHFDGLGSIAIIMGDYPEAHRQLERSLAILRRVYGPKHPRTAASLVVLGRLFVFQGRYDDSIRALSEAISVIGAATGDDSALLASPLIMLGLSLGHQGDFVASQQAFLRALALAKEHLSAGSMQETSALYGLGELAAGEERWADAERHHLESLRLTVAATGPDSLEAVTSYDALGRVYEGLGQHARALEEHRRTFEICLKAGAADSPAVVDSLAGQATALLGLGRAREAQPLIERALLMAEKDSSDVGYLSFLRFGRARALYANGRRAEGVEAARLALAGAAGDPGQKVLVRAITAFLEQTSPRAVDRRAR